MIALLSRYRWTAAWIGYVTYCIVVYRLYEVFR